MKMTITETMFKDAFVKAGRKDQFSYEGLTALFGYIEELEEYGEEWELDVIALCCDFSEHESAVDCVINNYNVELPETCPYCGEGILPDNETCPDCEQDVIGAIAMDYLSDNTHVIEFDGGIIIQSF